MKFRFLVKFQALSNLEQSPGRKPGWAVFFLEGNRGRWNSTGIPLAHSTGEFHWPVEFLLWCRSYTILLQEHCFEDVLVMFWRWFGIVLGFSRSEKQDFWKSIHKSYNIMRIGTVSRRYPRDSISRQYRYCIDTLSILDRYSMDTLSLSYRYRIDIGSISYRYRIDIVSM